MRSYQISIHEILTDFAFNEEYKRVQPLGVRLAETPFRIIQRSGSLGAARRDPQRSSGAELQRQLDSLGHKVKKGLVQDAISSPQIRAMRQLIHHEARRRSRDGSCTKKGSKSYFGYKLHSKVDTELGLIGELETTTASVHDSQVDLSREGEVVYRDRGYQGAVAKGYAATMKQAARDHLLASSTSYGIAGLARREHLLNGTTR